MKKIRQLLVLVVLLSSVSLFAQNRYLNFDGNDDFIDFQSSIPAFSTNLTIEAWIRTTSSQDENTIVCWGESGADNVQFRTTTSGKLQLGMDKYGAGWEAVSSSQSVNNGVRVHVAAVKSGTDVTLYVNGVEAGTGSLTRTVTVSKFAIGTFRGSSFYSGDIDDVRIWDDVRTTQEIQNNMNTELAGDEQGLVAYYKLNETTGTTAYDSQTSGTYNGTLSGFTFDSGSVSGSQWAEVYYVDLNATGNNDGTSWNDAFSSLQSALNVALSGDEIWVAAATYYPSTEVGGSGDRFQSFQMIDDVAIYGGFAGTETTLNERTDFRYGEANETILSGDFNNDDVITGINTTLVISNKSENAYHVFRHPDGYTLTSSAILDGFTLRGGNASGSDGSGEDDGGGITNMGLQSPTINNCTFTGNTAKDKGGAISNTGGGSPEITNCKFIKNVAAPAEEANDGAGGAINNFGSAPTIVNCLFYGNQAGDDGDDLGGAIYNNNGSNASIINCTVIENSAYSGGGIYNSNNSDVTITNTIIYGNIIEGGTGSQVRNWDGSDPTFTNCNIEDGWDGSGVENGSSTPVDGGGNINSDPEFTGTTLNPSHPYSLLGSSPCADAGDNTANSETYDIRGSDYERKLNKTDGSSGTIDIGAYEYKYGVDYSNDNIIFVDYEASGNNDGTTWDNAYASFQDALDAAASGQQIWVASGTYKPSQEIDGTTDAPAEFAFQMIEGVEIYGGFAGTETIVSERIDYTLGGANETILSGDMNGDDVVSGSGSTLNFSNTSDNTYQVFNHPLSHPLTTSAILDGFTIKGAYNTDLNGGGMMNKFTAEPTIRNCVFTENYAKYGGGIACVNIDPNISYCSFTRNYASNAGGGLYIVDSDAGVISGLEISGNYATNSGGGIYARNAGEYYNCFIYSNYSGNMGGGVYIANNSPVFNNLTITMNEGVTNGGGIFTQFTGDPPEITNSIIWNNNSNSSSGKEIAHSSLKTVAISYSDINGCGGSGGSWNSDIGVDGGNNIDFEPYFVGTTENPDHPYSIFGNSPCVDAGDNTTNSETYDIRGSGFGRKLDGTDGSAGNIDMGAYEYKYGTDPAAPSLLYVDVDASAGESTGLNWTDAFTSFQDALDIAVSGGEIWVAEGTYKPSQETDGTTDTPAEFAFQMIDGVEIYGGFAGTESNVSERTNYGLGEANETILSGDLNGDDEVTGSGATLSFSYYADNTNQVFQHPNNYTLTSSAVLDGFTIKGAHNTTLYGGGMINYYLAEPAIRNCVFTENFAKDGGGIASYSSPNVLNCTFTRNEADSDGGALYVNSSASSGIVSGLKIYGNYAANGGGIFDRTSSAKYYNCLIYDNACQYDGGGVYISYGSPALVNLTITMNEAGRNGDGIFTALSGQTPELINSILWDNDGANGDQVYHNRDQILTISYSNIRNSGGSESWGLNLGIDGGNNIDENPLFYDDINDDFRLITHSPCADAGNNSANNQSNDVRGVGFDRILNSTIDMGAYEYNSGTDPDYALAVWSGAMSVNWATYGNWLNNSAPGPFHNVTIPDEATDPIINNTDAATINNLTIESGASLTLESWSNGTASLIVNGTVTNNGTFETECFLWELGWHLLSPSTTGVTANDFYWDDDPMSWLTSHSEASNGWTYNTDLAASMPMGQGWSVWVDDNEPSDFKVASMIGSMRLTNLDVSLSYSGSGDEQGWNLLGNPFTASLDWDEGSWGSNTTGTVYVWDTDYNSGDYRTRTGNTGDLTEGIIPISQGFFVKATSAGDFTIPADARVHSSEDFYKNEDLENTSPYVRLQMDFEEHGNTVFIGFPEHGTSGFDIGGDADKLFSNAELPQIYVLENSRKLSTNSLKPLGADEKTVPLNLTQVNDGDYTFTLTQQENLPGVTIRLEDLKTGIIQDMREMPVYEFTAVEGDDDERFLLHFKKSTIGIDETIVQENANITIYSNANRIYVQSASQAENESGHVEVFNMAGQKLMERPIPAGNLVSIPIQVPASYIIVRVIKPSEIKTEKVFTR